MNGDLPPILGDVNPSRVFRTCNGVVIRNVYELLSYLKACSDYDFKYHVNMDHFKNDFAIWVREVVQDEVLARELDAELNHQEYVQKIEKRLQELEHG